MRNPIWFVAAFLLSVLLGFIPAALVSYFILERGVSGPWGRELYWFLGTLPFLVQALAFGAICGRMLRIVHRWRWLLAIAVPPVAFFALTMLAARPRLWLDDALLIAVLAALAFYVTSRRAPRSASDPHDLRHRMH